MATWKFMQIEPQPARGRFLESMWDSDEWVAEEKFDGDRRVFQFFEGYARVTGRRVSVRDGLLVEKTENIPHLSGMGDANYINLTVPAMEGIVLDGEMVHPARAEGGQSKLVTSVMGSNPAKAVAKQISDGWLQYVVFDCLYFQGNDIRWMPYTARHEYARQALEIWQNQNALLAEQRFGNTKQAFLDEIYARGGEGIILKHVGHTYGNHLRWVKVKNEASADVIITGFKPAREFSKKVNGETSMTKYAAAGLIGAVLGSQYKEGQLVEVASVSGMNDIDREVFTRLKDDYIGRVMTITHNGREPTGKFRHPRFCKMRSDKNPSDCVYWENET